ncbi:MAG: hypothetical protein U9O87_03560 [Verrucomicrobiota bacterium]|nr:hypothetical protein [Verrucomicrobiota bacterium]
MLLSKYMRREEGIVNMIALEKMKYIVLFLVLSLTMKTIAGENNVVFKAKNFSDCIAGKVPSGVKVIETRDVSVLSLQSKNRINVFLKDIPVEPHIRYKLSFQVKVSGIDNKSKLNIFDDNSKLPSWEIRILDSKGRLPYEGYLKNSWQRCFSADWHNYQQTFYTPKTAAKLQIIFSNGTEGNSILIRDIKVIKIISDNILINSDFLGAEFDYSGWSELNRAQLIKEKGVTKLNINPGGYALTDPVPIALGKYIFAGMANIPEMFFYDADMMRINVKRIRNKTFSTPANIAYIQFFFSKGKIGKFSLKQIKTEKK